MYIKCYISYFLLIMIASLSISDIKAEGSKTASPNSTNITSLAQLPDRGSGAFLGCPEDNRIYFRIKDFNTEKLYFGFDWHNYQSNGANPSINTMYMRIFRPDGTIFSTVNLPSTGAGYIANHSQAIVGPIIGAVNPTGYNPLSITPTVNGEWWVEIYRSNNGGTTAAPSTTWSFSPYFDLTVATNTGTIYDGRVHCDKWAFTVIDNVNYLTSTTLSSEMRAFCYTGDSVIVKLDLEPGFRPIAFDVSMNQFGPQNTGNWYNDRRSINTASAPSIANGFKLFLNIPDTTLYPPAFVPNDPSFANPAIVGCPPTGPYKIRYKIETPADVAILFDLNGTPGYQENTVDRMVEDINRPAGLNIYNWDGKDGLGNYVASGATIGLSVFFRKGRVNIPFYDAELNINGFKISAILPLVVNNLTMYWNDTLLTSFGTCPTNGANQANNITNGGFNNSLLGDLSPGHAWNGNGNSTFTVPAPAVLGNDVDANQCNDYGNVRSINTWVWGVEKVVNSTFRLMCVNLSGTVWDDANNSANNTFSNIYTAGENGTNAGGLFATIIDPETGRVLASVPINPDGTYTITGITALSTNLPITISTTQGIVDSLPPATFIPANWDSTTPLLRYVSVDTLDVANVDFGIELRPTPSDTVANSQINPGGNNFVDVPATYFSSTDIDGTTDSIKILTFPSGIESITIGGINYNASNWPAGGITLQAPGGIPTLPISVDPLSGNVDVIINYYSIDNAGKSSSTIGSVKLPFVALPPVTQNIGNAPMNNSQGATSINPLVGADADGVIDHYTITSIPPLSEGVLLLNGIPVTVGQELSPLEMSQLQFDPNPNFVGTSLFSYTATDNDGLLSNSSVVSIPVFNNPPTATNILTNVLTNTNGAVPIPPLLGSDADGTVVSYTITTIPDVSQGVLYLNGVPVIAGQVLSPADVLLLSFDPAPGYVGNVNFTYVSTDNNGQNSALANYTIPVNGSTDINLPPVTYNILSPSMSNSIGATAIPGLQSIDPDGTVVSYTIASIPLASQGVLLLNGVPVLAGQVLTPLEMSQLQFDPNPTFIGDAVFSYSSIDNSGNVSNVSNYTIPVTNNPPVSDPITTWPMSNSDGANPIPPLHGSDGDGTVVSYTITTIPAASTGVLYLNGVPVVLGQVLTPLEASQLSFDPAVGYLGEAVFSYTSTDNSGLVSPPALYTIPVVEKSYIVGLPPISYDITSPSMPNTNGGTAIGPLVSTDADGNIVSYEITSLPSSEQGVLLLNGVPVVLGQTLSPADINQLSFDPAPGYIGNTLFNYNAMDNSGNISNMATYTIPVTGFPPVAVDISNTVLDANAGATSILPLQGSDIDGSVVRYVITSLPPEGSGVLLLNGVPVVLGQSLTPTEINQLQFDPTATWTAPVTSFNYVAIDNTGNISNTANYTIPLNNTIPLPIQLLDFSVINKNCAVGIIWTTISETGVNYFEIERIDQNGLKVSLAKVNAKNTNATNTVYNLYDYDVKNSEYEYILKEVDLDGQSKKLASKVIQVSCSKLSHINIVPNPARDICNLIITSTESETDNIKIVDMLGNIVYQTNVEVVNETKVVRLPINQLAIGNYSIIINNSTKQEVLKLTKE